MKSPLARLVEIFTKPKIDLSTLIKLDRASAESNLRHTDFFRGMSEKEKNTFLSRMELADEKDQIRVYLGKFTGRLGYVEHGKLYPIK